jgi:hypothetical protein
MNECGGSMPPSPVEIELSLRSEYLERLPEVIEDQLASEAQVLEHIAALAVLEHQVRVSLQETADAARDLRIPWKQIGAAAGCSGANAYKRWGKVRAADRL